MSPPARASPRDRSPQPPGAPSWPCAHPPASRAERRTVAPIARATGPSPPLRPKAVPRRRTGARRRPGRASARPGRRATRARRSARGSTRSPSRASRSSRSTPPRISRAWTARATWASRASSPTPAGSATTCTAGACTRCASSRASARRRNRISATTRCSSTGRPGSRSRSTTPRSWATTATIRRRTARSESAAWRWTACATWRSCSPGSIRARSRPR